MVAFFTNYLVFTKGVNIVMPYIVYFGAEMNYGTS